MDKLTLSHWLAWFLIGCVGLISLLILSRLIGWPRLLETEETTSQARLRNGLVITAYLCMAYFFLHLIVGVWFWAQSGRITAILGVALLGICQLPFAAALCTLGVYIYEAVRRRIFM